jgi:hypothetical protein
MKTKTIHPRKQSGSSLVVVISVLATLMVIVGVAAEYTYTVNRHVQRSNTLQTAVAVGDSCIDILFSNWRTICSGPGNVNTPQTTDKFASIPLPTATQLNLPSVTNFAKAGTSFDPANDEYDANYIISNFKVVAVGPEWTALSAANATPIPSFGQISGPITTGPPPTTSLVYNYIASADVTLPALGPAGPVVAKVRRVFQKQQLSPWNFAIFYEDPLEIHPGPPFTVTGWVHTNSDLFTGHNTLTFADKVTYGSQWFVDFKPGETYHAGQVPASPNYPSNLPPAHSQSLDPFGKTPIWDPSSTNPNDDGWQELIQRAVPGFPDPLAGVAPDPSMRYYDQAAIKILIDASGNRTIMKLDGTTVTSSSTGNDLKLYTAVTAALTSTAPATIQDNREAASVRLTTLDIGSINTSLTNSSGSSNYISPDRWNGIIYITDVSGIPGPSPSPAPPHRGIRLKNAKVLPIDGVTVASQNPVYIQGDYNTGTGTVPSNIPPPLNDPTQPQSSGYTRQPAAVIADAVNILSNNWSDANAQIGNLLSDRVATNTTINTAIVAGIVPSSLPSGDGSYSGGAENFPRFLELWDATKFTYYGSMVELFNSQQAKGEWTMTNVYGAPDRQWYFDNNFKTKPPRGSLMIYSYIKGKWSVL